MAENKPKKPKYKYTRELVRIARDDGMTQEEIAKACRVQQSVVSGWEHGTSRAYEHQIEPLKKRYGHRLNRTTSRVYLAVSGPRSDARFEDSELARRLAALAEETKKRREQYEAELQRAIAARRDPSEFGVELITAADVGMSPPSATDEELRALKVLQEHILPGEPEPQSLDTLVRVAQEDFEADQRPVGLVHVEGPIVLRYTFVRLELVPRKTIELGRIPIARWLVHRQVDGRFVLVRQERRVLTGQALFRWRRALERMDRLANQRFNSGIFGAGTDFTRMAEVEPFVECTDDAARWLSTLHGPMSAAELLEYADTYFRDPGTRHGPHDEQTLPFLLKKMLLEHGHDVPGVARIPATG